MDVYAASASASTSKPHEVVERAGGWDIVPEGAACGGRGWETEGDGEVGVVGDADIGALLPHLLLEGLSFDASAVLPSFLPSDPSRLAIITPS
jgi:hypothetical protein